MKKYYVVRCTNRISNEESDPAKDPRLQGKDIRLFSAFFFFFSKEEADLVAEELNASVVPAEAEIFGTEFKVFEVDEGGKLSKKPADNKEPENKKTKKPSEENGPSKSSINATL